MIMETPFDRIAFDCPSKDCNISVFTMRPDQLTVRYVRERGRDYIDIEGHCPVCEASVHRTCDGEHFREIFNSMLEDIFRDINPNLPKGV